MFVNHNLKLLTGPDFLKKVFPQHSFHTVFLSLFAALKDHYFIISHTGEQGDEGLSPSASLFTFDLLVIMGSTVLLTAESLPGF